METDRHDPTPCPSCDAPLDASTSLRLRRRRRQPGDFSVCSYCAEVLRFTETLDLRRLTALDWLTVQADPELYAFLVDTQARLQDVIRRRGGG